MPEEPYTWKRLTADQRVHTGPLVFRGVILAADAVGTADVTIYDGNDAGGRQFATFKTPTSRTETHGPSAPVLFDQGLFVDVGSNVEEVVVVFWPLSVV
ncbi:MAG TPA: hypothetical protein DCQ64_21030 [Candidatus Rokubacteria bacterium]|nr:MAG: hypothetical protein A2138_26955 [Deltaproteobacteria bacterium RBG_16_71_12]HAM57761.1 hypothetical protein [Candidatus Rokubacteria bacterium]